MKKYFLIVALSVFFVLGYLELCKINIITEKHTGIIKFIPFGKKISEDVAVLNILASEKK